MMAFYRWAVATAKQAGKESACRAFIFEAEITSSKLLETIRIGTIHRHGLQNA